MNRGDLIDAIAKELGLPKATVDRFLDAFAHHVQDAVSRGDSVMLAGFGKFERVVVAARVGRNPLTREPFQIPETVRPRFTAGTWFKTRVKKRRT